MVRRENMIKAKEMTMKNMAIYLIAAMALSAVYYVARPQVASTSTSLVFMGDEVVVQRAITAIREEKAVTAPMPQPQVMAPLPIVPPAIAFKVLPVYPSSALENNLAGTVLLSVYVGASGQTEKIETKTSSGVAELDEAARAAVTQWKFSPAMQGSAGLASWFEVPVRFEIN